MRTYSEFAPTGFDRAGAFLPDQQDWLVVPCGTNRDADCLTESNHSAALALLEEVDPDGKDHEEHSFGHWACGHFEIIIVRPGSAAARVAEEIEERLEDYPVLDEEDWSAREDDKAHEWWRICGLSERVDICRRFGLSIFAARRENEIPQDDNGSLREYLLGS